METARHSGSLLLTSGSGMSFVRFKCHAYQNIFAETLCIVQYDDPSLLQLALSLYSVGHRLTV